jgi:hypothetical protein
MVLSASLPWSDNAYLTSEQVSSDGLSDRCPNSRCGRKSALDK